MQKTHLNPSYLSPSAINDAFQRAHAELQAAEAAAAAEEAELDEDLDHADDDDEPLLGGHELLHFVRDPIEWLLALAHRLAADEPDDLAAVDRLSAAFHGGLAGRSIRVRPSDTLTVLGLLVGALDPRVVLEAATKTIADGVTTILSCEGAAFAAQLANLATAVPVVVHRACAPRSPRRRGTRARPTT